MKTNTSQLHYIGYSMGTTVFFVMAAERPEYQSKIRSQISLAPVAYFSHTRSPIKYIAPYAKMMNVSTYIVLIQYDTKLNTNSLKKNNKITNHTE